MTLKNIYIDVETTGLNPEKNSIVHLAAIVEVDGKKKESFNIRMNPGFGEEVNVNRDYNKNASRVYTQETGFKKFINFLDKFINKYNPLDKFVFIAHNATFDSNFLRTWFTKNNHKFYGSYFHSANICTMTIAQFVFSGLAIELNTLVSYKLVDIAKFLNIKVNEKKLHDALYDIKLTIKVYKMLSEKVKFKKDFLQNSIDISLSRVRNESRFSKRRM